MATDQYVQAIPGVSHVVSAPKKPTGWFKRALQYSLFHYYFHIPIRALVRHAGQSPERLGDPEVLHYINIIRRRYAKLNTHSASIAYNSGEAMENGCPVQAHWLRPAEDDGQRVILYVHGGSFIHPRTGLQTAFAEKICALAGARALLVDYRLAPENVYPAAHDDVRDAYHWLLEEGIAPERIALVGESTGGGLVLSTLQSLRDDGVPLPAAAAVASPWSDLSMRGWSVMTGNFLEGLHMMEMNAVAAYTYLRGADMRDPRASPAYGEFHDLPPLLLHVSRDELYYDDACRVAEKLHKTGADLTMRIWREQRHTWQYYGGDEGDRSVREIAQFVRRAIPDRQADAAD